MSPSISVCLLQTQTDERLLAAARDGHERAFEALVVRYRKPLLRYCRRLLLPEARAEDALQQGLLQAWLALQRGAEVREVRAWLFRIVHNAAIDALRTSGYDHEELSASLRGASAPESDLERRTAVRQTLAGFATLPELQREALLRTAVEGHSHAQVAAALGLSNGAVRGLVYRARASLRAAATAITPPPLVAWAATTGGRGVPLAQRLGEVGAGGGPAGAAGAFLKGGAAVLSAGALVAGAVAVHRGAKDGGARASETPSPATARASGRPNRDARAPSLASASIPRAGAGGGVAALRRAETGRTEGRRGRAFEMGAEGLRDRRPSGAAGGANGGHVGAHGGAGDAGSANPADPVKVSAAGAPGAPGPGTPTSGGPPGGANGGEAVVPKAPGEGSGGGSSPAGSDSGDGSEAGDTRDGGSVSGSTGPSGSSGPAGDDGSGTTGSTGISGGGSPSSATIAKPTGGD